MVLEDNNIYQNHRNSPLHLMEQVTKYSHGHSVHLSCLKPEFGGTKHDSNNKGREITSENKRDGCYWDKRKRNNKSAKKSREKRRLYVKVLEIRLTELSKENHILKAQLNAVYEKYAIKGECIVDMNEVLFTMPSDDQILRLSKKRPRPMSEVQRNISTTRISSELKDHDTSTINNNGSNWTNNSEKTGQTICTKMQSQREIFRLAPHVTSDDLQSLIKDSGMVLNLSTKSKELRDDRRRSSSSLTSASGGLNENNSSTEESGYPRSPNIHGPNHKEGTIIFPHNFKMTPDISDKEIVCHLMSFHKKDPMEHTNYCIENTEGKFPTTGVFNSLISNQTEQTEEPVLKRPRNRDLQKMVNTDSNNIQDEVSKLTKKIAILKNILSENNLK